MAIRRCFSCKSMAELKDMRYDRNGKDLICSSCLAKENRAGKLTVSEMIAEESRENKMKHTGNAQRNAGSEESRLISYQCGSCNLGFSILKGAIASHCPYCGNNSVRMAFKESAQSLIEESARMKFED
ncbi:hypothetical protein HYX10_02020 [Candidatus Woesearchaeota archaeon]|nr:hypothetical protein [Candidatus Woesearchaeota archaeon]